MGPVDGIEPPSKVYKTLAKPLSYTGTHPLHPTAYCGEDETLPGAELKVS